MRVRAGCRRNPGGVQVGPGGVQAGSGRRAGGSRRSAGGCRRVQAGFWPFREVSGGRSRCRCRRARRRAGRIWLQGRLAEDPLMRPDSGASCTPPSPAGREATRSSLLPLPTGDVWPGEAGLGLRPPGPDALQMHNPPGPLSGTAEMKRITRTRYLRGVSSMFAQR